MKTIIMDVNQNNVPISNIRLKKNETNSNNQIITNLPTRSIIVNKGDVLSINFFNNDRTEFFILPTNFIECNGEPVIIEKIRIQLFLVRKVQRELLLI